MQKFYNQASVVGIIIKCVIFSDCNYYANLMSYNYYFVPNLSKFSKFLAYYIVNKTF